MSRPWVKFYESGVPHTIDIPDITLTDLFDRAVAEHPDGVAISFFGKRISYRELGRLVEQFAIALTRLGVKTGDRVAIVLPNLPQYPIVHFAALKIGAILVPTNPLYVGREFKYQFNNSGAETAVVLDFIYPRIEEIIAETAIKNVIVTSVRDYLPPLLKCFYPIKAKRDGNAVQIRRGPGIHFFSEIVTEKFPLKLPQVKRSADDTAILLYTGGTTGISKGAVLSHRNLVANVLQTRSWFTQCHDGKEVLLCALPFFHSYGLTTGLHMAVLIHSTMVLVPNPRDLRAVLKTIAKSRATMFSGVPTLYVAINNFPNISKFDISSIKACVSGSAPLPVQVAKKFETITGGKLVEGYGLSEASPVTHVNPMNGTRKEGSIGVPLPNTDSMIVDPETKAPLPVNDVGELAVRGPQVMSGYWGLPDETANVISDSWLFTGDMGRVDEDGYFYIVDRKKDMIIAGGFNIFPREIEEALYEHPKILEAAVIGVPDEYRGETVKAFIVCKANQTTTPEEVIQFCRQRVASFKVPKLIEFRDSLPKSNIGKVLKRVLIEEERKRQAGLARVI
jgi:long-chain acyl-CoA synthetase